MDAYACLPHSYGLHNYAAQAKENDSTPHTPLKK